MAEDAVLAVAQLRVVGWQFRKKDVPGLQPAPAGALLTLERDAANVHDKNAIRVLHNGVAIGFVERLAAAEAAPCLFDSRAAATALRLQARCVSFSDKYGHELRLEVHAAAGADVPEALYNAVSEFAGRFAPPSAQLRGQPGANGWVRKPSGVDARAWAIANRPSTFAPGSVAWLYASAPSQNACGPRVGKWQLFVSPGVHDEVWQSVLVALCEGRLGCAAKTAPPDADQRSAVVIVYTRDWEDRGDVLRVALELLRNIAPKTKTLCYKTDAHTIAGVYADDGPTSLFKIKPGETQLTVDEKVLAQARELVAQDAGGGGSGVPQQAPQLQAFTGTGRTLGSGGGGGGAAAPEVVSLLSDSDDDAPAAQPLRKAAKTAADTTAAAASRTAAAQKAAAAVKPWLRPDSDAADVAAAADAGTLGIRLLGTWAGVPPSAVARWLVEGASPGERVMTARECSSELRMRDAAARMPTGDAYAGARFSKVDQTETAPPSPAPKPKQESVAAQPQSAAAPSTNALLAGLHAERAARQRGAQ